MTNSFILVNDEVTNKFHALDRGLAYGDGLFETMRYVNGQIPLLVAHMARLEKGCRALSIQFHSELFRKRLDQVIQHVQRSTLSPVLIKMIVTRGLAGRGYFPADDGEATTVIATFPMSDVPISHSNEGIAVKICEASLPTNRKLAGIKHLNKLDYVLASREWQNEGFDEGLLLDENGNVVEATSRNIFAIKDGVLLTPSIDGCGVAGVLRAVILSEVSSDLALISREVSFAVNDLMESDEIFLCNSVTGVWPVQRVGGISLTNKNPVTKRIQAFLKTKYGY